jgi:hypothetical protein
MIKLPSLDDLKKAGNSLVDSAKSGKLMDQIKSQVETLGANISKPGQGTEVPTGDNPIQNQFIVLYASIEELRQAQAATAAVVKKFENQLDVLKKVIETTTTVTATVVTTTVNTEDKKDL